MLANPFFSRGVDIIHNKFTLATSFIYTIQGSQKCQIFNRKT